MEFMFVHYVVNGSSPQPRWRGEYLLTSVQVEVRFPTGYMAIKLLMSLQLAGTE